MPRLEPAYADSRYKYVFSHKAWQSAADLAAAMSVKLTSHLGETDAIMLWASNAL
ncbi:hypothetical protein [Leptothoe kymatousa]|uniref:Uncharacterized protein n=1 Tax=Leptothoe kymatousa TAU-MAC 1615 TaxID=2364775 RepID=A0ABS5Y3R8_9CYAN|nr:hypothetical protein [Leptothoe kymatousa]MBT9312483.1 hypothetical protein [Leptothoe kymatousa TAU-MAC 1615]